VQKRFFLQREVKSTTSKGKRAEMSGSKLCINRHFRVLTERAVLHHPDVESVHEDGPSSVLAPEGSVVFVVNILSTGSMVYAEVKDPPGWIVAQVDEKQFISLQEHADDDMTEFAEGMEGGPAGNNAEEICSLDSASENFCFVGSISSLLGLKKTEDASSLERKKLLTAFATARGGSNKSSKVDSALP